MNSYEICVTFTEDVLGAVPKNKEIYGDYVMRSASDKGLLSEDEMEQELETVDDIEDKGWTGFHQDDDGPFEYSYVWLGFFKDTCGMLRRSKGTLSSKIKAYKKVIDGLVFVAPRQVHYHLPEGGQIGVIERSLRASTAQGERVALARSDTVPSGTKMTLTINVLPNQDVTEETLREWLDYGRLRGLRQWRNAGYGTFTYEMSKVE